MSPSSAEFSSAERPRTERRSTLRLYKCWDAARHGKTLPAIRDFDFAVIEDLRSSLFLLGIEGSDRTPMIRYIGSSLSQEVGRDLTRLPLSDVPRPSLLAHVAYQYLRVIATRQPVAIEGAFAVSSSKSLFHRGVLLPFSESGDTVDAVLGSFRCRDSIRSAAPPKLSETTSPAAAARARPGVAPAPKIETPVSNPGSAPLAIDLRDALSRSRALAEEALQGETSSRRELYRALAACYAFFLEADADPNGYRALLQEARIRPQARAPFTPAVKLVFGSRLNKTQLSEYAAVLGLARRLGRPAEGLEEFIEERGLKHCVRDERIARREEGGRSLPSTTGIDEVLRVAPILGEGALAEPLESGFVLLLARRSATDAAWFEILALDADPARIAAAQRRAARGPKERQVTGAVAERRSA